MRRTLFFIPHEIAGIPVFGLGWALAILLIALVARLVWAKRQYDRYGNQDGEHRPPSVSQVLAGEGLFWGIAAVLLTVVLPGVELENVNGDPVGMAIRGYGVFLVCGVMSAVALAAYRSGRSGLDPDLIYALTPWVFIGGIIGARLFYVIQYRDGFIADTTLQTIKNMLAFTEGGLVVYGSFIGGFLAFMIFTLRRKVPVLRLGDAIVPCIFLGVFFGRLGCLLNGCCYGGRCDEGWAALHFPPITKVYQEQLTSGELLGMQIAERSGVIESVAAGSVADELGIKVGDVFEAGDFDRRPFQDADPDLAFEQIQPGWMMRVSGKTYVLSPDQLPPRALPVRAAQPISSLSALALCGLLCLLSLVIHRSGALMFLGFASYAVLRFVLEMVRVDESGQFNTTLTISQWVSVCVLCLSIAGLIWVYFIRDDSEDLPAPTPIA
ncbi:prolipoprotein diacylglyceryl transferase [Stieleria sp. TO1_6]|uniref:prolipoprotein diacylglyceryl transferase n=1 Tax=Stieleria tagensis TaxID=2956795 RepID=UPI00209AE137|nr:prolipoprotein diacylglyceryl transferase family protein [Stieleria tagensis]MCO8124012.1 prolipoprotein diacylglyceryl transferase [Stieleria tagensis]